MGRRTSSRSASKESPIQFRPGTELGQRVAEFSSQHRLTAPDACRCLIALAVNEMDARYYALIRQLADVLEGGTEFVRACGHVKAMVDGAALAAGRTYASEPERSKFILKIVQEVLVQKGKTADTSGLWFVIDQPIDAGELGHSPNNSGGDRPKRRRTIRRPVQHEPETSDETEDQGAGQQHGTLKARAGGN